jgi:hypothetical protein
MLWPLLNKGWVFARETSSTGGQADASFGRAKRCIFVFLNGGPSQLDTWDMKPGATADVRGELRPIQTSVPGIRVSELLPRMAALADRYKIVRSVTHQATVHTTGMYTMLTCTNHVTPQVDQTQAKATDHPHLGAVVARRRGWQGGMPPFVALPALFRAPPVEGVWPGQTAGFLGRRFDPFVLEGNKRSAEFAAPELGLPAALDPARRSGRDLLHARIEAAQPRRELGPAERAWGDLWRQGHSVLDSPGLRRALELRREPAAVHERYGAHLFGQGLLLARRLIEANVAMVTVYWIDPDPPGPGGGEFDSHGRIYHHMRQRLMPPADRALAALVGELWERGLHHDTLLVVLSEFGRTPTINKDAGRDHWPFAQSILLAGAGIAGGTVHGATDRHAAYPSSDPVTPPDLGQSLLHLMGVAGDRELLDQAGRPIRASQGSVDHRLIS